ncbi:uncharacterized protein LOC129759455 [Uranotaenia lowii]|uniref:uncharacterized protein LOC129741173 n=1 Tax=Uranotaenia lowii TaxID=190385 RepID=UPI0024798F15|nr:uncharacterized protein LOC129741173 [Uranotaenia lowii]XP_055612891.1 uncharacterized protein LOC129759455 [Uranotaenia lowii]
MVEDFILDVKLLAESCGFGSEEKENQIRDRIALGAADLKARERIYELENPSLDEIERILISREQMAKHTFRIETTERVSAIERIGRRWSDDRVDWRRSRDSGRREVYPSRDRQSRFNYRQRNRSYSRDRSRGGVVCSFCNMKGHIRRNCFERKKSQQSIRFLDDSTENVSPSFDFKRSKNPDPTDSDDELQCLSIKVSEDQSG